MGTILEALAPLDDEHRGRVLRWACERFNVIPRPERTFAASDGVLGRSSEGPRSFADLAEVFTTAQSWRKLSNAEKVLVVGYWLQAVQGAKDLDAQQVNSELKQLGHRIANVTSAFSDLIGRKPQFAIQVRKAGSSRQARKKYRLTTEGTRWAETLLSGQDPDAERSAERK